MFYSRKIPAKQYLAPLKSEQLTYASYRKGVHCSHWKISNAGKKKWFLHLSSRATGAASTQQVKVSMYHQNAASCSLLLALYRCLSVYSVNDEKPDIVFKQFSMRKHHERERERESVRTFDRTHYYKNDWSEWLTEDKQS